MVYPASMECPECRRLMSLEVMKVGDVRGYKENEYFYLCKSCVKTFDPDDFCK